MRSFTLKQRNHASEPEAHRQKFCLSAQQGVIRAGAPTFKRVIFVVCTRKPLCCANQWKDEKIVSSVR